MASHFGLRFVNAALKILRFPRLCMPSVSAGKEVTFWNLTVALGGSFPAAQFGPSGCTNAGLRRAPGPMPHSWLQGRFLFRDAVRLGAFYAQAIGERTVPVTGTATQILAAN